MLCLLQQHLTRFSLHTRRLNNCLFFKFLLIFQWSLKRVNESFLDGWKETSSVNDDKNRRWKEFMVHCWQQCTKIGSWNLKLKMQLEIGAFGCQITDACAFEIGDFNYGTRSEFRTSLHVSRRVECRQGEWSCHLF